MAELMSTILIQDYSEVSNSVGNGGEIRFANNFIIKSVSKLDAVNHLEVLSVYCAFGGVEYFRSKNCRYAVTNSSYLILNSGTRRSSFISSEKSVESFSVNFSKQFVDSYFTTVTKLNEKFLDDPFGSCSEGYRFNEQLYEHDLLVSPQLFKIRYLSEDWEANQLGIEESMSHLLESMVLNKRRIWAIVNSMDCVKASTRMELYERLTRARDYIHSCFKENISVSDLANVACLNQHYFIREFHKMFGRSPYVYLQNLRLKEASRMLKTTNKLVVEICQDVGYNDAGSFCKLFTRYYNLSPNGFRRQPLDYQRFE